MGVSGNTAGHDGSGSSPEPERLLAEALRAQAGTPAESGEQALAGGSGPAEQPDDTPDVGPPPGYGLLSGAAEGSLERERAALDSSSAVAGRAREPAADHPARNRPGLPARWVLLLAVLLGFATGSVIGLLTLL